MRRPRTKPLIVWRKNCVYSETHDRVYPVPSLILLANKQGFQALSKLFAEFAKKTPKYFKGDLSDPDDHMQIDSSCGPFDRELSDEMEMRIGIITADNKREVFAKYEIASTRPYRGDLVKQYWEQIRRVRSQWKQVKQMLKVENVGARRKLKKKSGKASGWISVRTMLHGA